MQLNIRIDRTGARRWLLDLATRLHKEGYGCTFEAVTPGIHLPPSIDRLVELERLLCRGNMHHCETVSWTELPARRLETRPADLIIDLSSAGVDDSDARGAPTLRVQSDGYPIEPGHWNAALAGRMPTITVTETATGAVVGRAEPCADNAASVSDRVSYAFEGCMGAILMALIHRQRSDALHSPIARSHPLRSTPLAALEYVCRSLAFSTARALYRLCCYTPHWRIGWRFLEPGEAGVHEALTLAGRAWRVLPDPGVRFYADPFPIQVDGRYYIFFEDLNHMSGTARISFVEVAPDGSTSPVCPALEEPWHLSYPFLFKEDGVVWMLPESSADRTLSLYRADPFPHRWVKEVTLLQDIELSDATLVRYGGSLWMLGCERRGTGSYSDTLSLFRSMDLKGPWLPHALNPVLINQREARPAGGFFFRNGQLWRPVQDCANGYGTGIGLAEIRRLDDKGYEQVVHTVLRPGPDWPGRRLHTLTRCGLLECIDGSGTSLKITAQRDGYQG